MTDKTPEAPAQNVTELPKKKRFDYKKIAKHTAFGATAVAAAVIIFKLASAPVEEEYVIVEQPAPEETSVA